MLNQNLIMLLLLLVYSCTRAHRRPPRPHQQRARIRHPKAMPRNLVRDANYHPPTHTTKFRRPRAPRRMLPHFIFIASIYPARRSHRSQAAATQLQNHMNRAPRRNIVLGEGLGVAQLLARINKPDLVHLDAWREIGGGMRCQLAFGGRRGGRRSFNV